MKLPSMFLLLFFNFLNFGTSEFAEDLVMRRNLWHTDSHKGSMIRSEIKAGIHHFIVMRYCCIHLAFDLSLAFSGCCLPVCLTDAGGRVAGQLQAKPKGGVAYSYQLHCSILRMQRSEIKRAHQMRGGGSKLKRLSFQFQLRQ